MGKGWKPHTTKSNDSLEGLINEWAKSTIGKVGKPEGASDPNWVGLGGFSKLQKIKRRGKGGKKKN